MAVSADAGAVFGGSVFLLHGGVQLCGGFLPDSGYGVCVTVIVSGRICRVSSELHIAVRDLVSAAGNTVSDDSDRLDELQHAGLKAQVCPAGNIRDSCGTDSSGCGLSGRFRSASVCTV